VRRGTVAVVALPGDAGKPRPAVSLRGELFGDHDRVTVVPLTSELRAMPTLRVTIETSPENGLQVASQAMIDRITSSAIIRIGQTVGQLAATEMAAIDRAVLVYLGFAD
jgi:mRNA interferase MazF